jgi:MFS family permease
VGKLPPAIATLQQALGVTLVQAGFLLSLVQLAGMSLGVAFGVLADGLGLKRSMVIGLALLALVSAAGGAVSDVPLLMLLRAAEGLGFLLVVLPAPGLVRRLVVPGRLNVMLGLWGAYMPLATALALLLGPLLIAALGWRAWWWTLAAISAAMALWLAHAVPAVAALPQSAPAASGLTLAWTTRLARTLAAPGPWLVALTFALYSGQWLAVVGFLPVIYTAAGLSAALTGVLTALAAGVNMVGNIAAGRLLHRGWPAPRLLRAGFVVMGLAAAITFAGAAGEGAPPWLRYLSVLAFSMVGGLIPGTLFALAVRLAPGEAMLGSTVGWVQQWSALGQFAGPPLVAWLASSVGGWQFTWIATGACSLLGLALSVPIARRLRR